MPLWALIPMVCHFPANWDLAILCLQLLSKTLTCTLHLSCPNR